MYVATLSHIVWLDKHDIDLHGRQQQIEKLMCFFFLTVKLHTLTLSGESYVYRATCTYMCTNTVPPTPLGTQCKRHCLLYPMLYYYIHVHQVEAPQSVSHVG